MNQPKPSALFNMLTILALSLCASIAGSFMQAHAQGGIPMQAMPPVYQHLPGTQNYNQNYTQLPPGHAPITGNVYQNGVGGNANGLSGNASQAGPENVMIILDSSYSMAEPLGGRGGESKMQAAKRTVLEVVHNLNPNARVGLRIYGDSQNSFSACRATRTLVPIGDNNRNLIASKMIGVRPTGATPISYTIERSLAEDFNGVPGKKTIILISDGMETCGEDPCNVAVRMQQAGVNVKMDVVGLGLDDYAAIKQLRCVALATKGQYYTANTAAELSNSLNKALAVETKVQGTILTNPTPTAVPAQAEASSAVAQPKKPQPEEKLLPAVPSKKR